VGFGVVLLFGAVAIRGLHYRATAELLARDVDVQLWARLGVLKAEERFAPDDLLDPNLRLEELFLPTQRPGAGVAARHGARGTGWFAGHGVDPRAFSWFAGVWRRDGTLVDALELPAGVAWEPEWVGRLDSLWTGLDGRHRLAATAGAHDTVLVVGTPLTDLAAARREALRGQIASFVLWVPLLLGFAWLLLSRLLAPLEGISRTARRIRAGHFEERIDLTRADAEIASLANTINEMLERLDGVRLAQSRFNADVAHQLLNPVHGILLEAEVARGRERSAADLASSLDRVSGLARRIEALCEALLTFSRTAALDPARLEPVDLEPILEEAVEQVVPLASGRGVAIDVAPGSAVVRGDAGLLHEVFVNLLTNAVEHSPSGSRIEVETFDRSEGCAVVVADHGCGVAVADEPRIFEHFFSGRPVSHAGSGHGVGLALCQRIVGSHGGTIMHRPTPGGGATFEVRFPTGGTWAVEGSRERVLNDRLHGS